MLASLLRYVMPQEEVEPEQLLPSRLEAQPTRDGSSSSSVSAERGSDSESSSSVTFSDDSESSESSESSSSESGADAIDEGRPRPFDGRYGIRLLKVLDEQAQIYIIGHTTLKAFILTRRDSAMFKAVLAASESTQAYIHTLRPLWMSLGKLRLLQDERWRSIADKIFDVLLLYRLHWAYEKNILKAMVLGAVYEQARPDAPLPRPQIFLPVKTASQRGDGDVVRRGQGQPLYEMSTVIDFGGHDDEDSSIDKELKLRKARERQRREDAKGGNAEESAEMRRWNELPEAKQKLLYERYRRTGTGKRRVTQLGGVFDDGPSPSVDDLGEFELPTFVRQLFDERKKAADQKKEHRRQAWTTKRAQRLLTPYVSTLQQPLEDLVTWFLSESGKLAASEEQWAVLDLVAGSFCNLDRV